MVLLNIPSRLQGRSKNTSPVTSRSGSPKAINESSLVLKVSVNQGRNLAPKDKNGLSDPYLVLQWSDYRFQTEAQPKTLNPVWNDTFDMPLSGARNPPLVCVCWDKDRFGKDYMGECEVNLDEVFTGGKISDTRWFPLKSSRKKAGVSGEIQLTFALVDTTEDPTPSKAEIFEKWTAFKNTFAPPLPSPASISEDVLSRDIDFSDDDDSSSPSPEDESSVTDKGPKQSKTKKGKSKKDVDNSYRFSSESDVLGVIFLEVSRITDLPPEKNVTRTGFDMDPFVVVSLGKKTFKTKHIRHNLNPVYDEKMLFQVLRHEQNYSLSFAVVDRDKFSSNDFVAETVYPVQEIIKNTQPAADPETGLYSFAESQDNGGPPSPMSFSENKSRFRLPLSRTASSSSLSAPAKQRPDLVHRSSSKSLRTVSTGPDGGVAEGELTINPPSPNRAIPAENIEYALKPVSIPLPLKNKDLWQDKHKPELYFKVKYVPYPALRQHFWRAMLRQYDSDDSGKISRVELTTMLDTLGSTLHESTIDSFFQRFWAANGTESLDDVELTIDQAVICLEDQLTALSQKASRRSSDDSKSVYESETPTPGIGSRNPSTLSLGIQQPVLGIPGDEGATLGDVDSKSEEHVIQIRECPLCHQPRMNKRSEMDIVTHLATCASQDWRQVDKLVMGGFVTSSQAQRKWYSKVISKVSYGGYKLGANSANILVQDRITGQIQEERMSVYVRLGIRLLYKGLGGSSMEKKRIRKLLSSMSVKQGKKFDNPASARDIKGFIAFHQLDMSEVLRPLEDFKTFNEFFYRELKPGARPCTSPDNPKVIVSPADCRCVTFNKVDDATRIWIKGREFTIARLLGDAYPEDVKRFEKGTLGIFRLAPQDYHRFHCPVDGIMGEPKLIPGEYYTVNPMAVRSALDVYGENVRVCVPFDSKEHGRVMAVCVGAMMVGSTVITAKPGPVSRVEEFGYFQFGGSTIVLLFEPGKMMFDADLIDNSNTALETLVRVGMSIGHSPDTPAVSERKENVTQADMDEARRRIGGSLAPTVNM